jgi:hypothetical protein
MKSSTQRVSYLFVPLVCASSSSRGSSILHSSLWLCAVDSGLALGKLELGR